MNPILAIISVFLITCNGLSIKVSEKYDKSDPIGDNLSNWEPFKDKHEQPIAAKKKVKKRLASPMNYNLVAAADDDYYEKGGSSGPFGGGEGGEGGDGDNDDNYESKDWSDLNRDPLAIRNHKEALRNLDLTDIEGIDVVKKQNELYASHSHSQKAASKNEVATFEGDDYDVEKPVEKPEVNPIIAIHTTTVKNQVQRKNNQPKNSEDFSDYYDSHKQIESKIIHAPENTGPDKLKRPKNNDDMNDYYDTPKQDEKPVAKVSKVTTTTEKNLSKRKKPKKNEITIDYYDTGDRSDKVRSNADQSKEDRENETKKLKILDSVDDLKERHAQESKLISEKFKEEELQREEFERNSVHRNTDKYRDPPIHRPKGRLSADYEEYEERPNFEDKYQPKPVSKTTVKTTTTPVTKQPQTITGIRKMSVFKSPHLYLSYDDDETTERAKYTTRLVTLADNSNERISLIPEDAKEGEPTLFFPKKFIKNRKVVNPDNNLFGSKPQNNNLFGPKPQNNIPEITTKYVAYTTEAMTTEPSYIMDTTTDIVNTVRPTEYRDITDSTDMDMSGVGSDLNSVTTNENIDENTTYRNGKVAKYWEPRLQTTEPEPFGSDSTEEVTTRKVNLILQVRDDLAPEASDQQNKEYNNRKAGDGREHESEHESNYKEHGNKRYETDAEKGKKWYLCYVIDSGQEEEVSGKGYHNVKKDIDKYDAHEHVKEVYGDDSGHYANHDHREEGKKHAEYEETGKHSKGHSTKGSHDVHKKEEYEKKEEFFENSGEEEDVSKNRKAVHSFGHSASDKNKNLAALTKQRDYEVKRETARRRPQGAPDNDGKKWIYHHGYPARNNNLYIIDRRRDHWPAHYG